MDDTGYYDMRMIADWKLDMMAKAVFMELRGERREAVRLACRMIRESYCVDKPANADYSAIRANILRTEDKISTLIDLLMDGDISKDEYKMRRDKLETELRTAKAMLANKADDEPIPMEEKLRWQEIEQTLNRMIDFSGDRINEDILNKFISRVTPLGDNRYAFHMNLDNGLSEPLFARVEGRKNKAAVSTQNSEGDAEASPYIHHILGYRPLQGMQSPKIPFSKIRLKSGFSNNLFFFILTADRRLCGECSLEELKNLDFMRVCGIGFSFKIDFAAALAFRRARGEYLREHQFQTLEVEVWI
jgi:hypothetical protein